ncbi:MAG: YbaK/EbsC family protein [Planctomycetota bacterium]|nr:YbaK/EbsC family protein [Planctomycetota bacterium]
MNIVDYLKKQKAAFEMHEHPAAYTAQEVAAEEHVSGNILAKTVIVHTGDGYAMCVLPASYKLDMAKVAKVLKSEKVRLADETELAKLFPDVEVGAAPPFGNLYGLPTLVDENLAECREIAFQAGDHRHAILMVFSDYAKLVDPATADLAVHL